MTSLSSTFLLQHSKNNGSPQRIIHIHDYLLLLCSTVPLINFIPLCRHFYRLIEAVIYKLFNIAVVHRSTQICYIRLREPSTDINVFYTDGSVRILVAVLDIPANALSRFLATLPIFLYCNIFLKQLVQKFSNIPN